MKRIKKVFRADGGLSPAFCERLRTQVEVHHLVGRSLAVAHLEDAYEDEHFVYMVQELCTGVLPALLVLLLIRSGFSVRVLIMEYTFHPILHSEARVLTSFIAVEEARTYRTSQRTRGLLK